MKEQQKAKKGNAGITLIALIITIIVLIILAGISISMLAGDNSILNQAATAKEETSTAEIEEQINLAVVGALADGLGTLTETNLKAELTSYFGTEGTGYTITGDESSGWTVTVDDNSYEISSTGSVTEKVIGKWYIDENGYITDGDTKLEIGDYVDYNPGTTANPYTSKLAVNGSSEQEFEVTDYSGYWKVLGVEDGKILLVSENTIGQLTLYGQLGYQNGISELNSICSIYGEGTYAESARSITVEDINKITGYDAEEAEYGDGYIYEYGNEVTYTLTTSGVKYVDTLNDINGTNSKYTEFTYYDSSSKSWKSLEEDQSVKIKSTEYAYTVISSSVYSYSDGYYDFNEDATTLDKLIGINGSTNSGNSYWLGSNYVNTYSGYAYFGLRLVYRGDVSYGNLARSDGGDKSLTYGVRAVVFLQSDVTLTENGDNSWILRE